MAINGVEMITDRAPSDIVIAKTLVKKGFQNMTDDEKQEFLKGLKGAYNYTDFNRVESAVEYRADLLCDTHDEIMAKIDEYGIARDRFLYLPYEKDEYLSLSVKTDWETSDMLTTEDMERYLKNARIVADAFGLAQTGFPETMRGMSYSGANAIERSLDLVAPTLAENKAQKEAYIESTAKAWVYSDEIYGGET